MDETTNTVYIAILHYDPPYHAIPYYTILCHTILACYYTGRYDNVR